MICSEIKEVRKRKDRAKELEGIDMSNIVSSTRRRSTTSFVPPPKPKVTVKSDSEKAEDIDSSNDEDGTDDDSDDEDGDDSQSEELNEGKSFSFRFPLSWLKSFYILTPIRVLRPL